MFMITKRYNIIWKTISIPKKKIIMLKRIKMIGKLEIAKDSIVK